MKTTNLMLTLTSVISFTCTYAKTGYFWHITDFHYDPLYTPQGDTRRNCRRADERGSSGHHRALGRYGDYSCDSSLELIESAARYMRTRHSENVEFVLWTGDILAAHYTGSEDDRYLAIRNMTDLLGRTFSSHFVFPVLGHLDPAPSERLTNLLMHWLPSEALQTFKFGGYYTIEQKQSKLRIVALNTNFFSMRESSSIPARKQWEWLDTVLEKATDNKEMVMERIINAQLLSYLEDSQLLSDRQYGFRHGRLAGDLLVYLTHRWAEAIESKGEALEFSDQVYIVGHAAPGSDFRHGYDTSTDANARYLRMVRRYARIIAGQFFGHLHADTFRVIYDNDRPVSWTLMAPSVSPHREPAGSSNPGLRLYKFDTNTGKVLDYTQYYLDLATANRNVGAAEWTAEYNLTQYYNLHEVSAYSLHNLADKLRIGTPQETNLFTKYLRAYNVRHETTDSCDGACAHQHFCAITCLEHVAYLQCVEAAASALAAAGDSAPLISPLMNNVATLFTVLLFYIVLFLN